MGKPDEPRGGNDLLEAVVVGRRQVRQPDAPLPSFGRRRARRSRVDGAHGRSRKPAKSTFKKKFFFGLDSSSCYPPYIRIQQMQESDGQSVQYLNQNYAAAAKENYDIYVCFVERRLKLLNEGRVSLRSFSHINLQIPNTANRFATLS